VKWVEHTAQENPDCGFYEFSDISEKFRDFFEGAKWQPCVPGGRTFRVSKCDENARILVENTFKKEGTKFARIILDEGRMLCGEPEREFGLCESFSKQMNLNAEDGSRSEKEKGGEGDEYQGLGKRKGMHTDRPPLHENHYKFKLANMLSVRFAYMLVNPLFVKDEWHRIFLKKSDEQQKFWLSSMISSTMRVLSLVESFDKTALKKVITEERNYVCIWDQ
jgi:hypothetical protein